MKLAVILFLTLVEFTAQAARPFLACDYGGNKVCVVNETGEITWQYSCRNPQDCWRLPNGNYLFCYVDGAAEVTPTQEKKVVWQYKAPEKVEVHACQPLPDGNVLITEAGTSRIIEVDRAGKIVKEIKLRPGPQVALHNQFRGTRKLSNGHYLVVFKGDGKIAELDADGKVLKELKVPGDPHEAVTLPDGHLLVTCGDGHKVLEFNQDQKIVWELSENDVPGNPLRLMGGCQRLPNGNTIFINFLGHGHIGKQPQFFELTRDKKVVWEFTDHAHFNSVNQIQVLDVPGDVTKGEILR
jgi:hypothetical protein